ncbi:hypothetical protein [Paenibacillus sp. y28]|uniref:hypothetical protein n=1 Tax=Paenibacillus sp. y28 TaxID=3129110 RepID=UPI0030162735
MSLKEAIQMLRDGNPSGGHDVYEALLEGEALGEHAAIVKQWAYEHQDETTRHHLVQAWSFHCLQTKDLASLKQLIQSGDDAYERALNAFEPAWRRDMLPDGEEIHEFLLAGLQSESVQVRYKACRVLCDLADRQYDLAPLMDAVLPLLHDHAKTGWGPILVSWPATAVLYHATLRENTREQAAALLKKYMTDRDKKTALRCASSYAHYLVDRQDFEALDSLLHHPLKLYRLGAAEGLARAIYEIEVELDLSFIQNNLTKTAGGKLKARHQIIQGKITVEPFDFPPVRDRLILLLQDAALDIQQTAADALREARIKKNLDVSAAIPALCLCLHTGNAAAQQSVCLTLSRALYTEPAQTIEAVIRELEQLESHSNKKVRQEAASALHAASSQLSKRLAEESI